MKLSSNQAAQRACVRSLWLAACLATGMVASSTASAAAAVASASPAAKPKKPAKPKATSKQRQSTVRSDSDPDQVIYGQRADVMQFAAEVAQRQGQQRL
jgi:hypothetical protein